MITIAHLAARASRPLPALPGASPALTHEPPDAGSPRSDRRPGSPLDQSSQTRRSAASTRSRVPLRRKRPAGTQGSGDIDKPSAVTERACSIGDHALSEIDAPGPRLTPACGGRLRRPRTEEWPLPDDHPRSRCQLGALDPRSPITEEGLTTVPLPPPRRLWGQSLRPMIGPLKSPGIRPFFADGCAPWAGAGGSKSLSDARLSLRLFTWPIRYPLRFSSTWQGVARAKVDAEFEDRFG